MAELPPRPSFKALFEDGKISLRSAKFRRNAGALSWRQKYLNADIYPIEMNDSRVIRLQQVKNGEMTGVGTGCSVWPAAHVLTKFLEKKYENGLEGVRVCDIGSGTGCTGIAAACLGATATLTDQLCVFPLLSSNVSAAINNCNISADRLVLAEYNWGESVSHLGPPFDVVLVSDCVLPKLYPIEPLVQAVDAVMGPASIAYFSYEHRPFPDYDPRQEFRRIAHKYALHVKTISLCEHDDVYSTDDIEIWEVRRVDPGGHFGSQWQPLPNKSNALCMLSWGDDKSLIDARLFDQVSFTISQASTGSIGYMLNKRLRCFKEGDRVPLALDIGAGCGLTSIILSLCGYHVIAVDKDTVTPLLTENISAFQAVLASHGHALSAHIPVLADVSPAQVMILDWNDSTAAKDIKQMLNGRVLDLIVCSDCVYQSSAVSPLERLLLQIATGKTELLIANEMRSSFDEFVRALGGSWKIDELVLASEDLEVYASSKETAGDPSFARFERPVRLISAVANSASSC